jgi:hypothetical protein
MARNAMHGASQPEGPVIVGAQKQVSVVTVDTSQRGVVGSLGTKSGSERSGESGRRLSESETFGHVPSLPTRGGHQTLAKSPSLQGESFTMAIWSSWTASFM